MKNRKNLKLSPIHEDVIQFLPGTQRIFSALRFSPSKFGKLLFGIDLNLLAKLIQ